MLEALTQLTRFQAAAIGVTAIGSTLWSLVVVGLLLANRRVPPIVALLPTAAVVLVACGVALWSAGNVPWDVMTVGAERRIALSTPDFLVRVALFPAIYPGLVVLVAGCALAAPLRGPRTTWPAAVGALLLVLAFVSLTTGAVLDLAVAETGVLLFLVGPLSLAALIGLVRGNPDGAGHEASAIGTVAFGHAVAAGVTAVLATARYQLVLTETFAGDPAVWRAAASVFAVLAVVGMAAAATTGVTQTRPRTYAGLAAFGTLFLWAPLAMVGALTQLV
jgi:hypothetical protein